MRGPQARALVSPPACGRGRGWARMPQGRSLQLPSPWGGAGWGLHGAQSGQGIGRRTPIPKPLTRRVSLASPKGKGLAQSTLHAKSLSSACRTRHHPAATKPGKRRAKSRCPSSQEEGEGEGAADPKRWRLACAQGRVSRRDRRGEGRWGVSNSN